MKKIDILKVIEANLKIMNNSKLLSITKDRGFPEYSIKPEYWFPNIEELKEEFEVLRKEVQSRLDETNECKKIIDDSCCKHEIRLTHYHTFGCDYKCVFCGEYISSDNNVSFGYSINRNCNCANLTAKYQDSEDYEVLKNGYTKKDIYEIIINILKDKDDNAEIDLVGEFKNLNLKECEIIQKKKVLENYILIISGTNKKYIDNTAYITCKTFNVGIDFVKYFSGILNTKIELIDDNDYLFKIEFPNYGSNLKFTSYDTLEELQIEIQRENNIPFKFIIDLSELYNYDIIDNEIKKENINLELKELFPNSHIIRIKDLSKKSLKELSTFLHEYQDLYAYSNNKYYYLDDNEVKSANFDDTCFKIKKLLRK